MIDGFNLLNFGIIPGNIFLQILSDIKKSRNTAKYYIAFKSKEGNKLSYAQPQIVVLILVVKKIYNKKMWCSTLTQLSLPHVT